MAVDASTEMNVPMQRIAGIVALFMHGGLSAQGSRIDIQAAGEHVLVNGDTPDSAREFALIAARRQAVRDVAAALRSRVDLAPLKLTAAQLEAYVAALIDDESTVGGRRRRHPGCASPSARCFPPTARSSGWRPCTRMKTPPALCSWRGCNRSN
jgi:hypothetical protein